MPFDGYSSINMKGRMSLSARDVDYASARTIDQTQPLKNTTSRASRASFLDTISNKSSSIIQGPILMDNVYLEKRSETFTDDEGETVSKRCFLLLCGSGENTAPSYMTL
jgi:hypothetical protein